jgi:hypothetical protein
MEKARADGTRELRLKSQSSSFAFSPVFSPIPGEQALRGGFQTFDDPLVKAGRREAGNTSEAKEEFTMPNAG